VGPSLEIVEVNLLKVLEKVDLEFVPFGRTSCVVVFLIAIVEAGCLVLRDESGTLPTTKLFASATKLEMAGDERIGAICDRGCDRFDVYRVLRYIVLVGDLGGEDSRGFSGNRGGKVEGHLFDDFLPFFGSEVIGKLDLAEIGDRDVRNQGGLAALLAKRLLEILGDGAESGRGGGGTKFDARTGLFFLGVVNSA
jgi:hypothetical protein